MISEYKERLQNRKEDQKFYSGPIEIYRFIADQPVFDPDLYVDDYVKIVASEYVSLLESKGYMRYDQPVPYVTDDEFWACFEFGLKENCEVENE